MVEVVLTVCLPALRSLWSPPGDSMWRRASAASKVLSKHTMSWPDISTEKNSRSLAVSSHLYKHTLPKDNNKTTPMTSSNETEILFLSRTVYIHNRKACNLSYFEMVTSLLEVCRGSLFLPSGFLYSFLNSWTSFLSVEGSQLMSYISTGAKGEREGFSQNILWC